ESQLEDGAIEKTVYGSIRPFELSRAPLMRTGVIQLENNSQLLLVDMHHLIRDGVGGEVFIDDFVSIYYGAALPPLPLQYKDYSIWQNSRQMTRQRKKQGDYWHNLYKGPVPRLDLPCDYPRPTQRDMKGDKIMFEIDGELSTRLDDFARATGTTLHMVMSAAFGILMSQYSRQEEIVIGSPVAGRNHPDLEKIIGMFVNMISVKYNTQKEKSITDYIAEVKKNTLNAMENQEYYFEELVTALGLQGDAGRNPLFDVVFSVENIETVPNETHRNPEIKESQIHPYTLKHVDTPFELILGAWKKDGIIKMRLTYATALFKTATIQRMTEDYREVLNQIADKTTGNLGDITLPHRFAAADMDIVEDNDEDFDF
ncbi:MAG: polyketide synthase, partial [bacterium]|nr:polyketide synthase [bacterium]